MIRFWFDWDWGEPARHLRRAMESNPGEADFRLRYAHLLSNLGRHEEALAGIQQGRAFEDSALRLAIAWPGSGR